MFISMQCIYLQCNVFACVHTHSLIMTAGY